MRMDPGLIALVGLCCFLWPFLYFAVFRTVNRPIIFLLSVSFACFAVALGDVAWDNYRQGLAYVPSGRRSTALISRDAYPVLFFFSSTFLFLCVAGLGAMGAYLLGIACMRRRRRA